MEGWKRHHDSMLDRFPTYSTCRNGPSPRRFRWGISLVGWKPGFSWHSCGGTLFCILREETCLKMQLIYNNYSHQTHFCSPKFTWNPWNCGLWTQDPSIFKCLFAVFLRGYFFRYVHFAKGYLSDFFSLTPSPSAYTVDSCIFQLHRLSINIRKLLLHADSQQSLSIYSTCASICAYITRLMPPICFLFVAGFTHSPDWELTKRLGDLKVTSLTWFFFSRLKTCCAQEDVYVCIYLFI